MRRRALPRGLIGLLTILLLAGAARPALPAQSSIEANRAEILWDTWGVPHVYAADAQGLFYGFGWAQMQAHGDLILRLYGAARGRAAEYWGKNYLSSDEQTWTRGIPARARDWYDAQSPAFRSYLDAFAAGINAFAKERPDELSASLRSVLPVDAVDVLAHVQRVIHFGKLTGVSAASDWASGGSNAWAIGPQRSETGHALLLANPHHPWQGSSLFFEAQLAGPGYDCYGATLVGLPVLGIAFNENLGWTHTDNTHDGADDYELTLTEGGYFFDGKARPFESRTHVLKVKQGDGSMDERTVEVLSSVHGPVVARKAGKALALRVVGLDRSGLLEEWWAMGAARDFGEFEAALRRMQIPMFTVIYADRKGRIMHFFNALVPVREKGTDFWKAWGVLPGDAPAALWTKYHPFEDLPRVVDPPSGWLQNSNDPPWTTTIPAAIEPAKFPTYMAPPPFMEIRAQHSARLLMENERLTLDRMVELKHSTRTELADRVLGDLIPAAKASGADLAKEAAAVLEAWDRKGEAESRGMVLFSLWALELGEGLSVVPQPGRSSLFAKSWDPKDPLATPSGLADPAAAVEVLAKVAAQVKTVFGSLDVPYGDAARLRRGGFDFPPNGGPGRLGFFQSLDFTFSNRDKKFLADRGDSFVYAVEFSSPVRAKAVLGYGNASQPGSPHIGDQLALVSRKELRPVWRTRQDVEAHLESRIALK
jgi:acyl-homoserine-lactone acylase